MMVLLDTCALLWWLNGDRQHLSDKAFQAIANAPTDRLLLSSASMHEIAIKSARGLLQLPPWQQLQERLDDIGVRLLLITPRSLSFYQQNAHSIHKDPFDRMIAAQAHEHGACVVSCDAQFLQLGVELIW